MLLGKLFASMIKKTCYCVIVAKTGIYNGRMIRKLTIPYQQSISDINLSINASPTMTFVGEVLETDNARHSSLIRKTGEARDRAHKPWLTRRVALPLQHVGFNALFDFGGGFIQKKVKFFPRRYERLALCNPTISAIQ